MPTISVDEYAKTEYERMVASAKFQQNAHPEDIESDEFYKQQVREEADQESKDRDWDDWKDDNPRGSGNKLVNRG
jgi:hypothetical protein